MEKVKTEEVSKKIFMEAIDKVLDAHCGGSVLELSKKLGVSSRTKLYSWTKGHMPPYSTMQEVYGKLIEISGKKNG